MPRWDPQLYLEFADDRSRPFVDLLARVGATSPRTVVDLGCGPGGLTATLARRWPEASVVGVDSSPEMVEQARSHEDQNVGFVVGDLTTWTPSTPPDVVVSNAALQWVPDHRSRLPGLVAALAPGGWLAFQVPGNFEAPSHRLLHELAAQAPYAEHTEGTLRPAAGSAADYLSDLVALDCRVDAWETTYLHVLTGPDAVFRWMSGTGARPVLQALPAGLRESFEETYRARLRTAHPEQPWGTVLPFRRVFVVAQRTEGAS